VSTSCPWDSAAKSLNVISSIRQERRNDKRQKGLILMTAPNPANRKPATPRTTAPVKLSGELVEVPSEALANEASAAESIAQDVEAPAD
jgi:hypothetical protein